MALVPEHNKRHSTRKITAMLAVMVALITVAGWYTTARLRARKLAADAQTNSQNRRQQARSLLDRLPLSFEPNRGQADASVQYVAHGPGYTVSLTDQKVMVRLKGGKQIGMKFAGSAASATKPLEIQRSWTNYYLADNNNHPVKLEKVPNFSSVRYSQVYPGVDAIFRGNQNHLRYDYVVKPGADASAIQIAMSGVNSMKIAANGDLVMDGSGFVQQKPYIYQEVGGKKQAVSGGYVLLADNHVGFQLGTYDHSRELVIDPTCVFGDYIAGTGADEVNGIAEDANGVYLVGDTNSDQFPADENVADPGSKPGGSSVDAFVISINQTGTQLNYRTFFGGAMTDIARGITIAQVGSTPTPGLLVVGDTQTPASTAYVLNNNNASGNTLVNSNGSAAQQAFLLVVDEATGTINTGMAVGGSGTTYGYAVTQDNAGDAFIGGKTTGLQTADDYAGGPQQVYQGGAYDGYVTKIAITGVNAASAAVATVQSTYVGGSGSDSVNALVFTGQTSADGPIKAIGTTNSKAVNGFPTTPDGFLPENAANGLASSDAYTDGFVVGLPSGLLQTQGGFIFGSFIGGNGATTANGAIIASDNSLYITGSTASTAATFGTSGTTTVSGTLGGTMSAYVVKLGFINTNPGQYNWARSTYIGPPTADGSTSTGNGLAIDSLGQVYVVGQTNSTTFPALDSYFTGAATRQTNPLLTAVAGTTGAFITRLNSQGTTYNYSGIEGNSGSNSGNAIVIDQSSLGSNIPNTVYFAGSTSGGVQTLQTTPTFATHAGFQQTASTNLDGWASALTFNDVLATPATVPFTVSNGTPGAATNTTQLSFTSGSNSANRPLAYAMNSCTLALTAALPANPQSVACSGAAPTWLTLPTTASYNTTTGVLTLALNNTNNVANLLPPGNYLATVSLTGPYDNGPGIVTVTLVVSAEALATPTNFARYFQKLGTGSNTSPNAVTTAVGGTTLSNGLNSDTVTVQLQDPPAGVAYTAVANLDTTSLATGCSSNTWFTMTPTTGTFGVANALYGVPVSNGTQITITYNTTVLQSMDWEKVTTPTTAPKCMGSISVTATSNGNVTPSPLVIPITMNLNSALIPSSPTTTLLPYATPPSYTSSSRGAPVTQPIVFNIATNQSLAVADRQLPG